MNETIEIHRRDIIEIHRRAMDIAEQGICAKRKGDLDSAKRLFAQALENEMLACDSYAEYLNEEPTRSILFRSGAAMAVQCGQLDVAEKLVAKGLSGNPPHEIAEELRELWDQTQFERHLACKGIELGPSEVQFSIAGPGVAPGIIPMDEFMNRARHMERLLYRTIERKMNRKFREAGTVLRQIRDDFPLFITVPRAASFAVTLKVASTRPTFPEMEIGVPSTTEIISEVMTCMHLYAEGQDKKLEEHITDKSYLRNFRALAENLAPDGKNISVVGLTTYDGNKIDEVAIRWKPPREANNIPEKKADERVTVLGTLRYADATRRQEKIKLIAVDGQEHSIYVPPGMMADIVRPLWDQRVEVSGIKKGRQIRLESIRPVDE